MKFFKSFNYMIHTLAVLFILVFLCPVLIVQAAGEVDEAEQERDDILVKYQEYQDRLNAVESMDDISDNGFVIVEEQIFPIEMAGYGEVSMIPAFEKKYHRLALFFTDETGKVVYKTEQLGTNSRVAGQMKQPDCDIAAVAFRDLNGDRRMDIILITSCADTDNSSKGKKYKVGDVLFQSRQQAGFYRDYRISDKINRFGMNKSAEVITAFVRDGCSTEFMYTASTLNELLLQGMQVIKNQSYFRTFEKLGRLQVVPGLYHISDYDVFMIYLVNEQGDIISSLQPMGDYDNLHTLRGIHCRDIDGDGLKDIVVLARYSYEDEDGQLVVESDYFIYYQRTGGFSADTEIKNRYPCSDDDTMEILVEKARAYWGWEESP